MRRLILAGAIAGALLAGAPAAVAKTGNAVIPGSADPLTVAVIGDTPYGDSQFAAFPALVDAINDDPDVGLALHLGDIKTGSSLCSDAYFGAVRAQFDAFRDPLLYTPGDNEWTDCHRPLAGGYLPTERLEKVRDVFYPKPGFALGGHEHVMTQATTPDFAPFVENVRTVGSRTVLATLHLVGSNNDLAPWFGTAETAAQRATRLAEFESRLAADLAWIDEAFDTAERRNAAGVVLAMQADMWDALSPVDGFNAIVQRIADRAAAYGGPVLLLEGDSHRFKVDNPLSAGSARHGVTTAAPNVTRIVVEGETAGEWLRLTIDPTTPGVFSWERVPV